jgi:predicted nucleic acid-binding Zn ribbon protein
MDIEKPKKPCLVCGKEITGEEDLCDECRKKYPEPDKKPRWKNLFFGKTYSPYEIIPSKNGICSICHKPYELPHPKSEDVCQ